MIDSLLDIGFLEPYSRDLWQGLLITAELTIGTTVVGVLFGYLLAIVRTYGAPWGQNIVGAYVEVIRNTPLIIQTFWLFFGLAAAGLKVPAIVCAIIALSINTSAYTAEIIRSGFQSISPRQMEAAESLGFSRMQSIVSILSPQMLPIVYPALVSQLVLMMLGTSVMSQIALDELTGVAARIQSDTFRGFDVYLWLGLTYVVLSLAYRFILYLIGAMLTGRRIKFKIKPVVVSEMPREILT